MATICLVNKTTRHLLMFIIYLLLSVSTFQKSLKLAKNLTMAASNLKEEIGKELRDPQQAMNALATQFGVQVEKERRESGRL